MSARVKRRAGGGPFARTQFVLYLGAIRSFISKRVHQSEVDDMVQDVALKMHKRIGQGPVDNVEGYLFQVARSVLADHGRRNHARMESLHESLEDNNHPVEVFLPDRILEDRQELKRMLTALRDLPSRSRQAFILHRFEEMSYMEIATHMGISVSAVEKNMMRAIRHLAAHRTK